MFLGIMWVHDVPYVLEINVRLGDPETQSLLSRLNTNFYELLISCAKGEPMPKILFKSGYSTCVVGVQKNYPSKSEETFENDPNYKNYLWAGLTEGNHYSGRVCSAVSFSQIKEESLKNAYSLIKQLNGLDYRHDIGI